MSDNNDDLDEFIEYELTKGCTDDENVIEYERQGYMEEHVELLEDLEEVDIKPLIVGTIEEEILPGDEEYLHCGGSQHVLVAQKATLDDVSPEDKSQITELMLQEEEFTTIKEEYQPNTTPPVSPETNVAINTNISHTISPGIIEGKTPKRYLLFDELVATVVDYDADKTPIVEFALARTEADERLQVECGICPDVMPKSRLAKHLKTHLVPGTTNRYQCIYCDETYKDYKYLAGHARRHMGIRPYVCEICKLYFSTKQDMRVHNQRRHLEKEHTCEFCGKNFAQNTQLKRHRESTHEKKRRFQCDFCPKAYYKNFSLQEHIRNVHMGKRRMLCCPFCGLQCRDAHKMARHRKEMHLNQSHFVCRICDEEFTDIHYFDAHKRSIQCRNNTKRKLEEEGVQSQELEEQQQLLLVDDPQGVQYILQQQPMDEVVVYDQMDHIIVEQMESAEQQSDVGGYIINEVQEQVAEADNDFIYEVTLETQE